VETNREAEFDIISQHPRRAHFGPIDFGSTEIADQAFRAYVRGAEANGLLNVGPFDVEQAALESEPTIQHLLSEPHLVVPQGFRIDGSFLEAQLIQDRLTRGR